MQLTGEDEDLIFYTDPKPLEIPSDLGMEVDDPVVISNHREEEEEVNDEDVKDEDEADDVDEEAFMKSMMEEQALEEMDSEDDQVEAEPEKDRDYKSDLEVDSQGVKVVPYKRLKQEDN